jgi:hypothetical protein
MPYPLAEKASTARFFPLTLYHAAAMASAAQLTANRLNAQASTGPRTDTGKAAVARNATSHGLSSKNFILLPDENPADFESLLTGLTDELQPETATEEFLVLELARAQWKIGRAAAIEAGLPAAGEDSARWDTVLKVNRYEQAARRAWYQAFSQLIKLRSAAETSEVRRTRAYRNEMEGLIHEVMNAPVPTNAPEAPKCETKPMPAHLQRELDGHKRRDPLFDPRQDRSQMSGELQRWFDRNPDPAVSLTHR